MSVNWDTRVWENTTTRTAYASSAVEVSLLTGANDQPCLPALFFAGDDRVSKGIRIEAEGILSVTGTPTWIFQVRGHTTVGVAQLGGVSLGVSSAITAINNVTTVLWSLWLNVICITPGLGAGNTTVSCTGQVASGPGFAAPYVYALQPTTPPVAACTAVMDSSLLWAINLSVTCNASSASNTCTLKNMRVLTRG